MKRETFLRVLRLFLSRRPYRPFTIELVNGSRIEINHPEAITLYQEYIFYNSTSGVKSAFDYGSVVRFIEATGIG